jgi:hypothetical protein
MNFVDLISQLEESKFLRLFRHLSDLQQGPSNDRLGQPAIPLDLPDAELSVKVAGKIGLRSWVDSWVFQIAHLPSCLWEREFIDGFIERRLRQAFQNLNEKANPLEVLRGRSNAEWFDQVQGCDYYLVTNVCHGLDDNALSHFSDKAHAIFEDVLKVPREQHPRFGIGNPDTMFLNGRSVVEQFILDLLDMPSSYYFVAREGRISIVPVIEHGSFFASGEVKNCAPPVGGFATVTSAQPGDNCVRLPGLSDFETVLNSSKTKEADLQEFFKTHPHFLFALDERYCEIRPHVCLVDAKRERLVPDFMARIEDSCIWDIIELKRPQHAFTVRTDGIGRASAIAARGVAGLLQYRDFFSSRDNRQRVTKTFGTAPYEPSLVLVIGRGRTSERYEWRSARAGIPRVQVVSYDYLFQRASECRTYFSERRATPSRREESTAIGYGRSSLRLS